MIRNKNIFVLLLIIGFSNLMFSQETNLGKSPCDTTVTLYVPLIFTPNADSLNDMFIIHGVETCNEFSLQIFNFSNVLMFSTTNPKVYWDGKTLEGKKAKEDEYKYLLILNGKTFTGHVRIVRR